MLNRNCTICSASKPFWAIRSTYKPVFHQYLPIGCSYSSHRCLECEIWWFSYRWQRQRQRQQTDKLIALPLAHVSGIIIVYCKNVCTPILTTCWQVKIYMSIAFWPFALALTLNVCPHCLEASYMDMAMSLKLSRNLAWNSKCPACHF